MQGKSAGKYDGGQRTGEDHQEEERQRLILELEKLAFSDIRDVFRPDGTLIPFKELHPDVAAAVVLMESSEEITRDADGGEVLIRRTVKVELADKVKNLELLGCLLGLFSKRVEVTEKVEGAEAGADTTGGAE